MGTETLDRTDQAERQTWVYSERSSTSTATELGGLVVSFLTLGAGLDPRSTISLVTHTTDSADRLTNLDNQTGPKTVAKQR